MNLSNVDIYLVGGAVRDQLLGRAYTEKDWVIVGTHAEHLLKLGFTQVGADFPVFLHPETKEEYALARTERKHGKGYKGFLAHTEKVTLEQDLNRRDLTINAIAQDEQGNLIDPYGGQDDLHKRLLRHVSDAFTEDPLRILRVARFCAELSDYEFSIAPETKILLQKMCSTGELNELTPERVWLETEKALASPSPRTYFETLRELGALKIILPEVDALYGVPQRPEFHPEIDCGLHCMLSMDRITEMSPDSVLRFAVLCHDLGKATTPADILPGHAGHEERSAQITENLCKRLKIPNTYKKLAIPVARYHLHCHRAMRLPAKDIVQLLSYVGAWKKQEQSLVDAFTLCCCADARGRTGLENRPYPQRDFLLYAEEVTANLPTDDIINKGYKGIEIGEQLALKRAEKLLPLIKEYSKIDELSFAKPNSGNSQTTSLG